MRALLTKAGPAGVVSLAVAVLVGAALMSAMFPLVSEMPAWDQWSMLEVFQAHEAGQPVRPLLLSHYNGHYNCLPRIIFYFLGLLSRWDTKLEVAAAYTLTALTLLVLLRMLWETAPRLLVLAAPFAAGVFSLLQFENFLNGYCMGQLLAQFATTTALYLVTDPNAGRWRYGLALAAAAAAYVSYAANVALAPAGLLALLLIGERRRWWRIGGWLAVSAFGFGLGLLGKETVHVVVLWDKLPGFAAVLLGRPFTMSIDPSPVRTAAVGAIAVTILVALLAWRARHEWSSRRDVLVRWGCLGLFPVGAALLIAVGRSWSGLQLGLGAHYVTATYPLQLALLVLFAEPLHRWMSAARGARKSLLAAAVLACCVIPLVQHAVVARRYLPILRGYQATAERNALRLALGTASDQDIGQSLHQDVALVRSGREFIRTRRLAWYAHAPAARRPLGELERVSGARAASRVTLQPRSPWVFEGWAVPPLTDLQAPVEAELIVDGRIVARTKPDRPRPDRATYFASPALLMSGFVLAAPDGTLRPSGRYQVRVVLRAARRAVTLRTLDLVVAQP